MKTINKIDVHHHIFPKEYVTALKDAGVKNSLGVDFPKWTVETSFKKMKENGIKIAMLSISSPGVYFKGIDFPELDTLHLDGVCLMTNYSGKYLGDEFFEPFFKELNKRNAVVYIHPNDPGDAFDFKLGIPNALIEVTFDTTRTVANMMYRGVLDRYPNIKYILSHGGGTIPFLAWRLAGIEYGKKGEKPPVIRALYDFLVNGEPTKGLNHLKKMYYDTAVVSGDYAVKTLQAFAGPDNIVFGSDLCINKLAAIATKNLRKDGDFTEEEYNKMSYGNCLDLFPSLKKYYN
ncbi:MAG: amidohydrolase family protein [Calditrichaceae bacterium]